MEAGGGERRSESMDFQLTSSDSENNSPSSSLVPASTATSLGEPGRFR